MFLLNTKNASKGLIQGLAYLFGMYICFYLSGCAPSTEEPGPSADIEFQIANLSQFDLDYVYLHTPDVPYKRTKPLMDNTLYMDEHISILLSPGDYLVTVVRQKNQTGEQLAYTTESPLYLKEPKRLIYYDDYFRLGDIEVFDEPENDSVVISSEDETNGCFIGNSR